MSSRILRKSTQLRDRIAELRAMRIDQIRDHGSVLERSEEDEVRAHHPVLPVRQVGHAQRRLTRLLRVTSMPQVRKTLIGTAYRGGRRRRVVTSSPAYPMLHVRNPAVGFVLAQHVQACNWALPSAAGREL